jgi:hypothetical protein
MTVGRIVCSLYHLGTITTIQNTTFALLNGQSVSRSSYPALSTLWPSGAYTSTSTNIHLPQTNTLHLRGANFNGSGDLDSSVRIALSGTQPTGNFVGSYQIPNVQAHVHASGSAPATNNTSQDLGGGPGYTATSSASTTTSTRTSTVLGTRPIELNKVGVEFEVDNTKVYFYIALN